MKKTFKLRRKNFLTKIIYKREQNFRVSCNFTHQEITRRMYLKCLICKNFDLGVDAFFSNLKSSFHSPDHFSIFKAPNHIPIFSLNWKLEEEIGFSDSFQHFGNFDWKKISEYIGGKFFTECDFHCYNIKIKKKKSFFSLFKRINIEKKKIFKREDRASFLKIWNVIFENKINWISQRGESFFEWKNTEEERFERFKFPTKNKSFFSLVFQKIYINYNKILYGREILKEFWNRNMDFSEKIFLNLLFNIGCRKSIERIGAIQSMDKKTKIRKNKEKWGGGKSQKMVFKLWIDGLNFKDIGVYKKIGEKFRIIRFYKHPCNKNYHIFKFKKKKKVKKKEEFFFISEKEKILCQYLGVLPVQFLLLRTLVLFQKTWFKIFNALNYKINPWLLCCFNEIMNNYYGLGILRNKFKKLNEN